MEADIGLFALILAFLLIRRFDLPASPEEQMRARLKSNVKEVGTEQEEALVSLHNDMVIVCAGGILPTGFLKSFGIIVEEKHGVA